MVGREAHCVGRRQVLVLHDQQSSQICGHLDRCNMKIQYFLFAIGSNINYAELEDHQEQLCQEFFK